MANTDVPPEFPEEGLFEGSREERFLAVAIETLVQDVSPAGDSDLARELGAYSLGESDSPEDTPEYVTLEESHIELANPPFLLADIDVESDGETYRLAFGFDSELNLLIDPPVKVTLEGDFDTVLKTTEQMLAEIYRTRGRRLEMLDEGVVDPEEFEEPR